MATITYNETTNGKFLASWTDEDGPHEIMCDSKIEAQRHINQELVFKVCSINGHDFYVEDFSPEQSIVKCFRCGKKQS